MSIQREPVVAAYGMGLNSTAYIARMVELGEPIDKIFSSNTGGERPETYAYAIGFSMWLVSKGYPPVTMISKGGRKETLEQYCLRTGMLPSLAYGYKSCSHKFKIEPQERECNRLPAAKAAWKRGAKVVKLIGYDIDEPHRAAIPEDAKYRYRYPLLEWGWGRDECEQYLISIGLPVPGKSACFFCPASRKPEILELRQKHPNLLARAIFIEYVAETSGKMMKPTGLGRRLRWQSFILEVREAEAAGRRIPMAQVEDAVPCGCYDGAAA